MTFSDRKVAEFVNANFVAAWINRGPGFHNEDYSTEQWIFRSSMEAYPTRNICTFFLTPEGKVFHYVAGSWAPEIFLAELEIAQRLQVELKAGGFDALRKVHAEAAERIPRVVADVPVAPRNYRGVTHEHSDSCRDARAAGGRYLAELHRHWSRLRDLPDFEEVRYAYPFGNSFTEEPRGGTATPIEGKPIE